MKKPFRTLLIAGILAGLAMQPAYGADIISQGATRIIRVGETGQAAAQTAEANTAPTADTAAAPSAQPDAAIQSYQPTPEDIAAGPGAVRAAQEAAALAAAEAQAQAEAAAAQAAAEAQAQAQAAAQAAGNLPAGIRALDPTKPMIALTYDDGPQTSVGNRIMNVMNQYGGKCTFFMVGDRVPSHAAEVQRMANEGFEVANHTQNHKYLNKLGAAEIRSQVEACNNTIQSVCGVRPTIMRLPGGNKNSTVIANVNMPIILWSIDTLDWKTRNAQSTINSILGKAKDGDVVLMHELYTATADATEALVPALVSQGFQLVTVSELAYYKGVPMNAGQIYYSIR
ncbi:MAG: polysaccharide deacetylase family protein [Lachnospiraceae bacterium]|nr:polysaccharide deacetylase family protein [Lachnospiraceae bacterium]